MNHHFAVACKKIPYRAVDEPSDIRRDKIACDVFYPLLFFSCQFRKIFITLPAESFMTLDAACSVSSF